MYPLNEAFASSIIQKMWSQPYGKDALMKLRNAFKDLDINRISDSDIQYLQPKDAFKINVDGLKFWINAGKIVGVTRSNSCFDRYFEVKRSKRGQIVDMDPAFLEMYSQSRKTWDGVVGCYVLDVNAAIRNGASVKGVERKRKEARTGALALKTNREIKQENIARYIKLLKDRGFSDGTEFALISNVNKLMLDHCKKVGATHFFIYDLVGSTFLLNYLQSYSNTLVEYIELLDKNGYILPTNVNADDYVDKEFGCIGSDFVLLNLKQEYMKDQERIQRIISIDFSKFVLISEDCRDEILITFIDLLPYFNLSRGRFNALGDDCLANRMTYSLSIYDFNVINVSPLAQRANLVLEEACSITDYYKDIPPFDNIANQLFKSPISENLKSKLILYGTAERYFLLHDCIECDLLSPSPYYKTKEMGIDEKDTWDRFIKDELITKDIENQCLLSLTKNELIELANKLDILVRKSWNKDKIYATILEDKNKENELKQFICDLDFYKINPIYENELVQLIDYRKEISQLIKSLFFI